MELKENIDLIVKTLIKSRYNFECVKYLNSPESAREFKYVTGSIYFRNIASSLWRICIIDLHKLISRSNNDKLSTRMLFNKLKYKQYVGHNIPLSVIQKMDERLTTNEHIIQKVIDLRNKVYAHTEVDFKNDVELFFDDVSVLYEMIEGVISEVFYHAFSVDYAMKFPLARHNGNRELKLLIDAQEKARNERFSGFFDNDDTRTNKL